MECNKEEALKAMQLSEKKILNNDFKAAKVLALKAQQLYPQLDNIFRLILVCEVHCLAEKKIGGSEMDWYGILQVQQTDDREIIKKQYRKLSLLLHPDKTSLPGAEAGFKLIGEAYRVLYDHVSRSQYDIKYKLLMGNVSRQIGHQFRRKYGSAASSKPQSCYTSVNLQQRPNVQQPVQPETTKRACSSCKRMYDYNFANRLIFCHRCLGIFDNGNATVEAASAADVVDASTTVKREIENVVEMSECIPLKTKKSRKSSINSGHSSKTGKSAQAQAEPEVIVLEKDAEPPVVDENYTRKSPRKIHKPSYVETLDDNDDNKSAGIIENGNVAPLKERESFFSAATKRKRANGSADGGVYRPILMALFAMDEYAKLGIPTYH